MEEKLLDVPRPTKLGECSQEARPCPWAGCRHHLLLEVANPKRQERKDARATSMRLNVAKERVAGGRRSGLASSAAAAIVRTWLDDAVEALHRMRYTCTFDVVRDYPDGVSAGQLAMLLGVTKQSIAAELHVAGRRWVDEARNRGVTDEND